MFGELKKLLLYDLHLGTWLSHGHEQDEPGNEDRCYVKLVHTGRYQSATAQFQIAASRGMYEDLGRMEPVVAGGERGRIR
jgi:hypothetical protein